MYSKPEENPVFIEWHLVDCGKILSVTHPILHSIEIPRGATFIDKVFNVD